MFTSFALALLSLTGSPAQTSPAPAPATAQLPAPPVKPTPDGAVIAVDTSLGTFEIGLYATKAPLSSRNIMNYVKSGFYAGTVFHRVIPGFMIQGGGMDTTMNEKPTGPPVRNEARNGLLNSRGSVALARTSDPHSATSQFYVSLKDNPALDFGISRDGWGYTVFGEVLTGMDVVDRIAGVLTSTRGQHQNVPVTPVVINKVRVVSEPASATPPAATKAGAPQTAKPPVSAPARSPRPRPSPSPAPSGKPQASPAPSPRG